MSKMDNTDVVMQRNVICSTNIQALILTTQNLQELPVKLTQAKRIMMVNYIMLVY